MNDEDPDRNGGSREEGNQKGRSVGKGLVL
jgi:hypothetical protein